MSYYLFLDDERHPKNVSWVKLPNAPWVIVRNYGQFVETVTRRGPPVFVTFDHDLAEEHYQVSWLGHPNVKEKTGHDCAKWLVEYCRVNGHQFPDFQIHSLNPIGKENIWHYIKNAKKVLEI